MSGDGAPAHDEAAAQAGEKAEQSLGRALLALRVAGSPEPPSPPPVRHLSLAGRATGIVLVALLVAAGGGAAAAWAGFSPLLVGAAVLLVGIPLVAWAVARALRPLDVVIRGVADGIRSFRDHDYSVRLAYRRSDDLGELVRLYNEVGRLLQEERHLLRQRELLLQTALDRSPAAILLFGPTGRIVYGNREARRLLLGGAPLEGHGREDLLAGCPPALREVLDSESDGIFTAQADDHTETYHVSRRSFRLNYRRHELVLLRRLTGELGRQEAEIWKKVLRIVSHELNNSLAPVSSLLHSVRIIAADPRHAHRADEAFDTMRERLDHLQRFLDGYARFARLPRPRPEEVDWRRFVDSVRDFPATLHGGLPAAPGWFDPAQMRQVLLNLFKNAVEASEGEPEVALRIESAPTGGTWIQVADRGRGMDEETMRQALLPFYSTKPGGSGLGLALCREILEAHGGKIALQAREGGGTIVTCWLPPR